MATKAFKLTNDQDIIEQIELFKQGHLRWVQRMLTGKITLQEDDITSYHNYTLGQWYKNRGKIDFGHLPEFIAIEQSHIQMHTMVYKTVNAFNQGDWTTAKNTLSEVEQLSHKVIDALNQLEQQIDRIKIGTEDETGYQPAPPSSSGNRQG